jgi:hypothetical protein
MTQGVQQVFHCGDWHPRASATKHAAQLRVFQAFLKAALPGCSLWKPLLDYLLASMVDLLFS